MGPERLHSKQEAHSAVRVTPPAVESFFHLDSPESPWPEEVRESESVESEIKLRSEILGNLEQIFHEVPNAATDIQAAIESGELGEENVVSLYEKMGEFFKKEDSSRLTLYFPFELLPNQDRQPLSPKYQRASKDFANAYMSRWYELLGTRDVRANFVDGDVQELEHRENGPSRVVKAAHLIPKLVERKLLSAEEVLAMLDTDDDVLRTSIADAVLVLNDMELLAKRDVESMSQSKDMFVAELAGLLARSKQSTVEKEEATGATFTNFADIESALERDMRDAENGLPTDISSERRAWLLKEARKNIIHIYGEKVAVLLSRDMLTSKELEALPEGGDMQEAAVAGLQQTIEMTFDTNEAEGKALFLRYQSMLDGLWKSDGHVLKDSVEALYLRLHTIGIVSEDELRERGIIPPELAGPFAKNLERMPSELKEISKAATGIESNAELSKYLYPASLIFGSRLKGYGGTDADIDLALFVRPGTDLSEREHIQSLAKKHFAHEKVEGSLVEFWLKDTDTGLEVIDFDATDSHLSDSSWTHVLFGGAWTGKQEDIKMLHEQLLAPYLQPTEKTVNGRPIREVWLEEMERDFLQYRLMHKGYARTHRPQGGAATPNLEAIDGNSTFWDSGYRRVATKLFLSRVLLPEVVK
ncbi:MAG: hypothetical protein V4682_00820 [Patescibacteria group bacterium]